MSVTSSVLQKSRWPHRAWDCLSDLGGSRGLQGLLHSRVQLVSTRPPAHHGGSCRYTVPWACLPLSPSHALGPGAEMRVCLSRELWGLVAPERAQVPEVTWRLWGRTRLFPLKLQTLQEKLGNAEGLFSDPYPTSPYTHHSLLAPIPSNFLSTPSVPKRCPPSPFHPPPILFH